MVSRFEHKHTRVRESTLDLALKTADLDGWELVSAVSTTINYERGFDLFFKRLQPAYVETVAKLENASGGTRPSKRSRDGG